MVNTIRGVLSWAQQLIEHSDSARLDAEILLAFVLAKDRSYLFARPEFLLSSIDEKRFVALIHQRQQGIPIAYLTGCCEFWSLPLKVTNNTLIPRPETEMLVEQTLTLLIPGAKILDLGTGTGAIAIAIAHERPDCEVVAVDKSQQALLVAAENVKQLQIANITLLQSDWFQALTTQKFDIIVSNPPYIRADDVHLTQGDVRYEPQQALISANQGLADIEKIIYQAPKYLSKNGTLLLEHGYDQADEVKQRLQQQQFTSIKQYKDLAGWLRVSEGCL